MCRTRERNLQTPKCKGRCATNCANRASTLYMSHSMRKPAFCICENKDADQLRGYAVTAKLISAFVFAPWIEQSLFYLDPKFQASSHLLWLYSLVCVGPGRRPRRPVFSQHCSYFAVYIVYNTSSLPLFNTSSL